MCGASNFEVLSSRECRQLLAEQRVGRVAFVGLSGYPVALPVTRDR